MDKLRIRSLSCKKKDKRVKKCREIIEKNENAVWNINYDFLDYLILFNENDIEDQDKFLDICKKYNTTLLVSKKREGKFYCAVIHIFDIDLYMEIPENGFINDSIFFLDTWIYWNTIGPFHAIRSASISGKPNANGYIYSKKEFKNAIIGTEYIQETFRQHCFGVEMRKSSERSFLNCHELCMTHPEKVIGYIYAIGDRYIIIKGTDNWPLFNNNTEMDSELLAYMVYNGNIDKDTKEVTDLKIMNYDIYLNNCVDRKYLEDTLNIKSRRSVIYPGEESKIKALPVLKDPFKDFADKRNQNLDI